MLLAGLTAVSFQQCKTVRRGPEIARERGIPLAGREIIRLAHKQLGVPYRYGGKSPRTGFDCSGFTNYVYRRAGYGIPRGARNQYRALRPVRIPRVGDLVFFRTMGRRVSHVGIYAGRYRFIHSPRTGKTVEYADIRLRYWQKRYAGARAVY